MTPAPTVYVYVNMIEPNGQAYWVRHIYVGTDHAAAASEAVDRCNGSHRIHDIETFDGEPQRFVVAARRYQSSKAETA